MVAMIGFGKPVEPLEWMIVTGRRNSTSGLRGGSQWVLSGCGARASGPNTSEGGWWMIDTDDGSARRVSAAAAEESSVSCTMMWEALVTVKRCAIAGGELFGERKRTPGEQS